MPEGIGPAGANTAGRNPKVAADITKPGTILSHTPKYIEVSKVLWERAIDAANAITSRENRESSMPGCPCVIPSHMAGTPPAT